MLAEDHGVQIEVKRRAGFVKLTGDASVEKSGDAAMRAPGYFQRPDTMQFIYRKGRWVVAEFFPSSGKLHVGGRGGKVVWAKTLYDATLKLTKQAI